MKKFIFKLLFSVFSAMVICVLFALPFALCLGGILLAGAVIGQIPGVALFETIAPDLLNELKTLKSNLETHLNSKVDGKLDEMQKAMKLNQDAIDNIIIEAQRGKYKIPGPEKKSFGEALEDALNEGNNYKNIEMLATKHKERPKQFTIELKTVGDITTANVTGGSRYGQVFAPNIIERPSRKVHMRSLIPTGTAGPGNTYTFMRESGDGEGAIATVSEGGTKPQIDFDLVETEVKFEVIAGRIKVTRKAMNNIPGFISFIQKRLPEKLLRAEDAQIVSGDGISPNLKGILTAGNFTAATSDADTLVEQIIDSLAQLEDDEDRDATSILLRPVNYYGFFKNKASGSGEYDLPENVSFANGVLYISGVPVYPTTAMTSGKYAVGDFDMGAQLLIQEAMRLEFFDQDEDNVSKNKITVRIEETVALPVYGDDYFIVGDVPAES